MNIQRVASVNVHPSQPSLYNPILMRACLFALLLMFCLPLQWAGAATGAPCVHEPCGPMHASTADVLFQADADEHASESHAQHPHCGSCHTGALAVLASRSFSMSDTSTRTQAGTRSWTEVLFVERPERPQWPTLA